MSTWHDPPAPEEPRRHSGSGSGAVGRGHPWVLPVVLLAVLLGLLLLPTLHSAPKDTISYSTLVADVTAGRVQKVTISDTGAVVGQRTDGSSFTSQLPTPLDDSSLAPLLATHGVDVAATGPGGNVVLTAALWLTPVLLIAGVYLWTRRRAVAGQGAGVAAMSRSRAKLYDEERPATRFADIAGYEGSKSEIAEVVDFLKRPSRYVRAGARGPTGLLMVGPPGTGKTLLARAVAGEARVPFFALSGSSFVEVFVGLGAARVRSLFEDARKRAPSIIFIDEIDAIGGRRGASAVTANDERYQTLNQLLSEMDGFERESEVVVMAATNRPDVLDPALLRPGRFDRTVEIPLPDQRERRAILALHTRGKLVARDVDLDVVARGTPGFSGADLANLVNEAAINAVRADRQDVERADFDTARDRILLGRRDAANGLFPAEKDSVAVHEAGHALVALLSPHADPVDKVTILPRGASLGVTQQLPEFERHLYPRSYLTDSLAVHMGGRAAELIVLGEASTGAANDLTAATDLATRMVREWGLSEEVGPVSYDAAASTLDQPLTGRPYAEATQRAIDSEVARLLREAEARAVGLLRDHRELLDRVVALLTERETVDGAELARACGVAADQAPQSPPTPAAAS